MPPSAGSKRIKPRFQVTLDRATIRTIERIRKSVLGSGSRSAAIRYLAQCYARSVSSVRDEAKSTQSRGPL